MPEKTNASVSFKLIDIGLQEFELTQVDIEQKDLKSFSHIINIEHGLNIEDNVVIVTVSIEIATEKTKIRVGKTKQIFAFEIKNLNEFVNSSVEGVTLETQLTNLLNSVSISTARGVSFMQFRGTYLHKAFIPIINVAGISRIEDQQVSS